VPFVGLFGTVWGVYHPLVAIGMSGSGMLDKVAGPVGEALIMTGIGLAVALPAVMGYNWLTRSNRVLTAKLDAFAFELLTFLSMGKALQGPSSARIASGPGNSPLATARVRRDVVVSNRPQQEPSNDRNRFIRSATPSSAPRSSFFMPRGTAVGPGRAHPGRELLVRPTRARP
jgi:hypothetical protein